MVITHWEIIVVELLKKGKITNISQQEPIWEIAPDYELGLNSQQQYVQNITIDIYRRKYGKQFHVQTRTSFVLTLASKEFKPTTPFDFELYTLMTQISLSHARVYFQQEAKGTLFAKDLIPVKSNADQFKKIQLALSLKDGMN